MARTPITALARVIDPRYPSNLFALAAGSLGGVVIGGVELLSGAGLLDAALAGFWGGVAVFLAWAIARELDPDHPVSAGIAAVLAVPARLAGDPFLAGLVAVLLAARIAVRSTGLAMRPIDRAAVVLFVVYLVLVDGGVVPALGLVVVVMIDGLLDLERWVLLPAVLGTGVAVALAWLLEAFESWAEPDAVDWALLVAGVVAALVAPRYDPESRGDLTRRALSRERLVFARVAALAIGLTAFAAAGESGIGGLASLWAAFVAVAAGAVVDGLRTTVTVDA